MPMITSSIKQHNKTETWLATNHYPILPLRSDKQTQIDAYRPMLAVHFNVGRSANELDSRLISTARARPEPIAVIAANNRKSVVFNDRCSKGRATRPFVIYYLKICNDQASRTSQT